MSVSIKTHLESVRDHAPREFEVIYELTDALRHVVELADELDDQGQGRHTCPGPGDGGRNCGVCCARSIRQVIGKELGIGGEQ